MDCPLGISMYHYEGTDEGDVITTYNIPASCVEVLTIRYSNQRGIAFAVDWRIYGRQQLWVNTLHDSWNSWVEK